MCTIDLFSGFSLSLLSSFIELKGHNSSAILAEAGLASERFDDPFKMVRATTVAHALNTSAKAMNDDNLGLNYGEYFAQRGAAALGQLQLTAPTVRDLLEATVEFAPFALPAITLNLVVDDDAAILFGQLIDMGDIDPRQVVDFMLAVVILRIRRGTGTRWHPTAADLAYKAPVDTRGLRRLLGDRLRFEQSAYRLELSRTTLDVAFPGVPAGAFDITRNALRGVLAQAPHLDRSVAGDTHRVILRLLAEDEAVTLEFVAETMNLSRRTLQLRLEQEHATFEQILLKTRIDLACRYLCHSDLPMREIACRLGFKSPPALSRWVVANFAETPTELRRRLRHERATGAKVNTPSPTTDTGSHNS